MGKYRPEKTPYFDTFYAMSRKYKLRQLEVFSLQFAVCIYETQGLWSSFFSIKTVEFFCSILGIWIGLFWVVLLTQFLEGTSKWTSFHIIWQACRGWWFTKIVIAKIMKIKTKLPLVILIVHSGAHRGFSEGRGPNFRKRANQYKTKKKRI